MKGILTFNLPEENQEHRLAVNAVDLSLVLWDLDQWLRAEVKYKDREELQEVRDKLWELINERNLSDIVT